MNWSFAKVINLLFFQTNPSCISHFHILVLTRLCGSAFRKKRNKVHRMGSIRYMSRNSHKCLERSRKDDLESWLYIIVEFFLTTSSLPWEDERNQKTVLNKKEAFMNNGKALRISNDSFGLFQRYTRGVTRVKWIKLASYALIVTAEAALELP